MNKVNLNDMVIRHYDNALLMRLKGEIHFDEILSQAEVTVVKKMWNLFNDDRPLPLCVYVPCGGTMRHVPHFLQTGIRDVVVVDLSEMSLQMGYEKYGAIFKDNASIYQADIRETCLFMYNRNKFALAVLMGNSLGDVTDEGGHLEFLRALSDVLLPNGILVFDYVCDGYNPQIGEVLDTMWEDKLIMENGSIIPVFDRRTRRYEPVDDNSGILHLTCEVKDLVGRNLVPFHSYTKRIVNIDLLREQFVQVGMTLHHMGPMEEYSQYHKVRNDTDNDLGMMGKPNQLFVAVKK